MSLLGYSLESKTPFLYIYKLFSTFTTNTSENDRFLKANIIVRTEVLAMTSYLPAKNSPCVTSYCYN